MPPRIKVTRQMVAEASFQVVRTRRAREPECKDDRKIPGLFNTTGIIQLQNSGRNPAGSL